MAPASARIGVDFASLARLAADLRALARAIADRDLLLSAGYHDPDLGPALRHAERDWSAHRREFSSFLQSAAGRVAASLDGYRQTERALTGGLK
ncbi:MAG: hypothetical protein ACR2N4_16370 [Jatrophihabitans sp.]